MRPKLTSGLRAVALSLAALALSPIAAPSSAADPPAAAFCVSSVQIELLAQGKSLEGHTGKLVLRPSGSEGEPIVVDAKVGTPARVALPCASSWEIRTDFSDAWGAGVIARTGPSPGGEPVTARVSLWPLGRIGGTVKLSDRRDKPPKTLTLTTLAPRGPRRSEAPPKGQMDCPVDTKGRWACPPMPATTYDLVFTSPGFSPQYRWALPVVAGKVGEVGVVELKRGASVQGWVIAEEGAIDPASCRVRLSPLVADGSGVQVAEKISRTSLEARVGRDGFFQITGARPGSYSLEVRQKGFATGKVAPIEVYPGKETSLREPIALKKPFEIELALTPPLDWLEQRWAVEVYRFSNGTATFRDKVYEGSADPQGLVSIPKQSPGRFSIAVQDSQGNRFARRELNLGPSEGRQDIRLDLWTLRGAVKLGKEPLAGATLWFGGRYGSPSVALESDADGKFHGVVPHVGWWAVDVESSSPKFTIQTRAKVQEDGRERATVELDLPQTHLFGRVLFEENSQPVPKAEVSLGTEEGDMHQQTDEAGRFEFRGMPAGMVYAAASYEKGQEEWTSDRLALPVAEGADQGPIEIRMRKSRQVAGIVQSPRGPVVGAGIRILPVRPTVMFGASARTDLDGSFTGKAPASTETAAAVVSAPGFALRVFELSTRGAPRVLAMSEESGILEIEYPEKPKEAQPRAFSVWIFQDGLPITPDVLYRWGVDHGSEPKPESRMQTIPAMAPGEYRVCIVAQTVVVPWLDSGWTAPLAKCTAGQLAAGATLRLDLSQP